MRKLLTITAFAIFGIVATTAFGLPTYEPFTENAGLINARGTNLFVSIGGVSVGTNASAYISQAVDLSTNGSIAPGGEHWTSLNFSGLNSSGTTAGAYQGLDVALINDQTIFTAGAVSSVLPSSFPGFPSGSGIATVAENPSQPEIWTNTTKGQGFTLTNAMVGNSPVLRFSQDITRPATGANTIYVSYLFSVAQQGQLGTGNDGRYLAFLCQSNLAAGIGTSGTYGNWFQMFNTFGATAPRVPGHGIIQQTKNSTYYVGPCDTSAGKVFSTTSSGAAGVGSFGNPIFVVGAYQLTSSANDTNLMWVNPSVSSFGGQQPPGSPAIDVVPAANRPPDIAGLALLDRPGMGTAGGVGTNYIANLIIGTTWSYVTGGPEFTTQPVASTNIAIGHDVTLTGAATAAGQTVVYQWQKINGTTTNNLIDGAGGAGGTATVSGSGTATLTLTGLGAGDVGIYQLMATASSTLFTYNSSSASVQLADPEFVTYPTNIVVNYGNTASFVAQVTTANAPLTYQWFVGSTPLSNGLQPDGSMVSGASGTTGAGSSFTLTLNVSGVSYQDTGSYTLYVTNNISFAVASVPASLAVNDPYFTAQPVAPSVANGGTANFTVSASGSPTLTYQWFEGTTALSDGGTPVGGSATVSGSTTAALTLTGVQDGDDGSYYCQVTSSASGQNTNSFAAGLVVQDPLTVITPPQSLVERTGDHTAFAVTVVGGGPQFQWSHNSTSITGATNSSLVLTNIQISANGTYSVTVQNASTSPQTYSATLTVTNSIALPLASTNIIVARIGDGAQPLSGATGNTLYLDQYTPSGAYVSTLQVPDEAVGSPYGTGGSSSVFNSPALLFQGAGGDSGDAAMLSVSGGNQEYLTVAGYCEAYPFSGSDITTTSGWRGLATINAFGIYSLAYTNVGLYNGGPHTIRSAVTLDGTNFWCAGQAGANGVKFLNTTVASYAGGSGIPAIASSATGPVVAQIVKGNLVFSDTNAVTKGLYICAGTPEPGASGTSNSTLLIVETSYPLDFAFSPDLNTVYIADGAPFAGTFGQGGGIQRWDTNSAGGGYTFSYTLPVDASQTLGALGLAVNFSANTTWGPGVVGANIYATTYGAASNSLVSIVDTGSSSTPTVITTAGRNSALRGVRFGPSVVPPAILTQPQSTHAPAGAAVTFSSSANGSGPFTYQWYFQINGTGAFNAIAGATNATYTVNSMNNGAVGNYYVLVTGLSGATAQSQTASLGFTAPPQFTSAISLGAGRGFRMFFTGPVGLNYSLRSSTNLSYGLTNWTVVTAGTLSGGTDNYTDSNGTNQQQFYIITSP